MGPQHLLNLASTGKHHYQSVLGTAGSDVFAYLHHNSSKALPSSIFMHQQSSSEQQEQNHDKYGDTELAAKMRSLTRDICSLQPTASVQVPDNAQLSQSPSQNKELDFKKLSLAEHTRESKAETGFDYHSVLSQNNQMHVKLDLLQIRCLRMEEEKKKVVELNDLKTQEIESKMKLVEAQAERMR